MTSPTPGDSGRLLVMSASVVERPQPIRAAGTSATKGSELIKYEGKNWHTVTEIAVMFDLSEQQVRRRIEKHVFEAILVQGQNHVMYLISEESVRVAELDGIDYPPTPVKVTGEVSTGMAARKLQVSSAVVRKLCSSGILIARRDSKNAPWRIDAVDLDHYANRRDRERGYR